MTSAAIHVTVTMIITTRNRSELLAASLWRLFELTPPTQLIIVDDGGTDDCVDRCASFVSHLPIEYIYTSNLGETNCCHARNVALRAAVGDEILVSEPELIFHTDVVAQMQRGRLSHPTSVLHEPFCYHEPHAGADPGDWREVPGFYVNFMKREWLLEVGGWDEQLPGPWGWDDIDLYGRLEQLGYDRRPLADVRVRHCWHPSRIEPAVENETYVRAKEFPRDIVANQGIDWGRVR